MCTVQRVYGVSVRVCSVYSTACVWCVSESMQCVQYRVCMVCQSIQCTVQSVYGVSEYTVYSTECVWCVRVYSVQYRVCMVCQSIQCVQCIVQCFGVLSLSPSDPAPPAGCEQQAGAGGHGEGPAGAPHDPRGHRRQALLRRAALCAVQGERYQADPDPNHNPNLTLTLIITLT